MNKFLRSFENFDNVFDPKTRSEELFGFGKKKNDKHKEPDYSNVTLEDIHKMSNYNKELFQKCFNMIKSAWNWKAYKLPKSLGKDEDGNEADNDTEGFEEKIYAAKSKYTDELRYVESVKNGKLIIGDVGGEGTYTFAYGQPTGFPLYWKVLKDISTRWKKRLEEKEKVIKEILGKLYDGISVSIDLNTGDGDEGSIFVWYTIEIPIKELAKPRKLTKDDILNLYKLGTSVFKQACSKFGNPKGFAIISRAELEEFYFYDDETEVPDSVIIGDYDAWEFTNNRARDEEEYEKFNKMLIDITNQCNKILKDRKLPYGIDCDGGDWDDGFFQIYPGEHQQETNYMS